MKKKPKGRPKGVSFTKPIAVKVTEEQHARWESAASAMNMQISVWVRFVVDSHLRSQDLGGNELQR